VTMESSGTQNSTRRSANDDPGPSSSADYRRLLAARGEETLAPIEDESWRRCYQTLTTQVVSLRDVAKLTYCRLQRGMRTRRDKRV